ncbi:MAG: radical SAM protein [Candidatus Omnitrophica bacterium]|nr:radical SAM protein [Candidatus Omnitrophota bacterium]
MDYFLDKPNLIKISLTNLCNFRCVMCYYPELKQEKGFISDELLSKILEECEKLGINRVSLGGVGEPLLHKNYVKYLHAAKSLGFWVSTTTNCSLLNKEIAEAIIREKLDRINLSIYSSDPLEHRAYTGTDTFGQVVENVKYLIKLWQSSNRDTLIKFKFLKIPGINDYEKFKEFWQPLIKNTGFEISVKDPVNWGSRVNFQNNKLFFGYRRRRLCKQIRYLFYILHNGDVLPCCCITEGAGYGEVVFGNMENDTIIKIWQSDKYLAFKNNHYRGKLSAYRPCRNCSEVFSELNFLHWVKKCLHIKLAVL